MAEVKLIPVGNSVGVILPRELLVKLGVQKGDTLFATDTPNGVQLSVRNTDLEEQMAVARELMKKWRNVLHELAK
jgi:putative addiction module antidote